MMRATQGQGCGCRSDGAADALYSTTQAISRELDDVTWAVYHIGDDAQRAAVDVAFDLASLSVGRIVSQTAGWLAEARASLVDLSADSGTDMAWQQGRNNFSVYGLVKGARSPASADVTSTIDLVRRVESAYGLGAYADLWAIEGLGHDYAKLLLDRGGSGRIMMDGPAASLPASSLTMMHAGLGLAVAERLLPHLTPCASRSQFRTVLTAFVDTCDANSRPGYRGAAYESLGLVARTWHPRLISGLDTGLREFNEGLLGFFWHGAGRALNFLPTYIVPIFSPWRAANREAPHELARRNLRAGLAWAWTLVNMRQPWILAELLRRHCTTPDETDAFINGLASAVIVAADITPNDPYATALADEVDETSGETAAAWSTVIALYAGEAIVRYAPLLRRRGALDEVFRHEDLHLLVQRLEHE
jgi:hypothetical protein